MNSKLRVSRRKDRAATEAIRERADDELRRAKANDEERERLLDQRRRNLEIARQMRQRGEVKVDLNVQPPQQE